MQHLTGQQDQNQAPGSGSSDSDVIRLLDYLEVVLKHRRMIIRTSLAAFIVSLAISLVLPNVYNSTTRLLPPQQDQGLMGMMMGQMGGGMASLAGDLLGSGQSADLYVGILNSEAVSDTIIDRFKLMQVYQKDYRLDAYRSLGEKVQIFTGKKDGIISVTVEDEDPKRAADIANAYAEELSRLTVQLNITGAGKNKLFLESRLVKAKADLAKSEDALRAFQSGNKALDITEQAKGTIQTVANLTAQLGAEEVKLAGLRRTFTDSSQDVKNQQLVVAGLRSQVASIEGSGNGSSIPSVGSVPALGQQYVRLMREFKVQEALVELLTKQYEVVKLTEAKDVSSLQVLQKARVADKKVKPKRALVVLASTFAAAVFALLYAFLAEAGRQMSEADRKQWARIRSMLSWKGSF